MDKNIEDNSHPGLFTTSVFWLRIYGVPQTQGMYEESVPNQM